MTDRTTILTLIDAATVAKRFDFARMVAAEWLTTWPGDSQVQLLLGQAAASQGSLDAAAEAAQAVINRNPENAGAYRQASQWFKQLGQNARAADQALCAVILEQAAAPASAGTPAWAASLAAAWTAKAATQPEAALRQIQPVLSASPAWPLPAFIQVWALHQSGDSSTLEAASKALERWPECAPIRLLAAIELLKGGKSAEAVDFLHQAVAADPTGEIAARLLGANHPYRALWPAALAINLSRPIPADVAAVLGENQLVGGVTSSPAPASPAPAGQAATNAPTTSPSLHAYDGDSPADQGHPLPRPEPWEAYRGPNPGDAVSPQASAEALHTLADVRREFDRLAARLHVRPHSPGEEQRTPAYIALTSRTRLIQEFGQDRWAHIDERVTALVEAARRRPGWTAYRVYIDDPSTIHGFGLKPADPSNAWQIKLRLEDLDRQLAKRREMIGALLIVGGPKIIPFHSLPNPTDDDDSSVPSDNPYATLDENYFAPQWPVGRIPVDREPELLVKLLRQAEYEHRAQGRSRQPWSRFRFWLGASLDQLFRRRPRTLGYSASIWRKASLAVYRAIGEPRGMLTSPPAEAGSQPSPLGRPSTFSYFNLHGVEDAPEWFGQRDPLRDIHPGVDFPIALRPQDVVNSGRAPHIVFTEACYGANVIEKSIDSALSLKFLDSGTHAIVGSTKVSYGSVTPPLIAADLLGRLFWERVNGGMPCGEALRQAKVALASEMHKRQGYLDGEDQKTLISFVLYGDPLYQSTSGRHLRAQKEITRHSAPRQSAIKTACALGSCTNAKAQIDAESYARVKSIVAQYLPGMSDASCRIHPQHCGCDGLDHICPTHQLGIKAAGAAESGTLVVTFAKTVPDGRLQHNHYARLTLDRSGKILKLAVSR
jgi:tetratricopeptide (TPR) repeat protein